MQVSTLYIAANQQHAGTLFVTIGIMEMLRSHYARIAFVRPIVASSEELDEDICFMHDYFKLSQEIQQMYVMDVAQAHTLISEGHTLGLYEQIIARQKELEATHDIIIFSGLSPSSFNTHIVDFDINMHIASNLNALYIPIINAHDKTTALLQKEIRHTFKHYEKEYKGSTLALFVNRLSENTLLDLKDNHSHQNIFFLPEIPQLNSLTLLDIKHSLDAKLIYGKKENLTRVIEQTRVASMGLEPFLRHIHEHDLIIVSGDRIDILLGAITAMYATTYPHIAGIVLTGDIVPQSHIIKLLQGLEDFAIPILSVPTDTYTTVLNLHTTHARIRPHSHRKIALAMGMFHDNVNQEHIIDKLAQSHTAITTPAMFEYTIMARARQNKKRIVLPESSDERILKATEILLRRNVVDIILLGNPKQITQHAKRLGIDISSATIIDPQINQKRTEYIQAFYDLRKHKGLTLKTATETLEDFNYFATMMVHLHDADGMVSGAVGTTANTIRPALQIIKTTPDVTLVSSAFFMCMSTQVLLYADCAINENPTSNELADIALSSAQTALQFGITPNIAMLSYSTGDSGKGGDVDTVAQATKLLRQKNSTLQIEGPIQYDAAIDIDVAHKKLPNSQVAGKANVFIFPDLNTGNNTYKAVQRAAKAIAIGPILQGLNKPVNDLSRGCSVADIVNTVVITAIQAQGNAQ